MASNIGGMAKMTGVDQPSARLRLAAELAVGLARRFSMTLAPGDTPGYYWHYAQTPFEDGCDVLWELGVALALVATGSGYQGMTRQQYVDAKRRPGEETFAVYKFFPAPELQDRNPIAAIAIVRAETGAGLHECRTYVDDLVRKSR